MSIASDLRQPTWPARGRHRLRRSATEAGSAILVLVLLIRPTGFMGRQAVRAE